MKYVQIVTIDDLPPMNNAKGDDSYSCCIFNVRLTVTLNFVEIWYWSLFRNESNVWKVNIDVVLFHLRYSCNMKMPFI